jgi:rod shape-determining protein MreB and related proteins
MFSKKIGIDLGTSKVRACIAGSKEIHEEHNILVEDIVRGGYIKKGEEALSIIGKENAELSIVRPIKNGVLQDIEAQKEILYPMIDKLHGKHRIIKPEFIVSIPKILRDSDKNSIANLVEELGGSSNIFMVPEVTLSAIGLKLPIYSSTGTAIVNLGAGTIEAAVLSSGGVNVDISVQFGGEDIDQLIVDFFKSNNILIGPRTAEYLKSHIISAEIEDINGVGEVKGKELNSGKAVIYNYKIEQLRLSVLPGLEKVTNSIKEVIEKLPPELTGDILDKGIIITGGLSNLKKLHMYLSKALGVCVYRLEDPERTVVKGLLYLAENPELLTRNIVIK